MNKFQIMLASNSDAYRHLTEAKNRLQRIFTMELLISEFIETRAVVKSGLVVPDAAPYLNALCLVQSELSMESVQSILKTLEAEMGRERGAKANGAVAIDLDLVVWNDEILKTWDVAQEFYKNCLNCLIKA